MSAELGGNWAEMGRSATDRAAVAGENPAGARVWDGGADGGADDCYHHCLGEGDGTALGTKLRVGGGHLLTCRVCFCLNQVPQAKVAVVLGLQVLGAWAGIPAGFQGSRPRKAPHEVGLRIACCRTQLAPPLSSLGSTDTYSRSQRPSMNRRAVRAGCLPSHEPRLPFMMGCPPQAIPRPI